MFDPELALRFAAALVLGLLLGLERERARQPETSFAGVRTFALIALLGATAAYAGGALAIPALWLVAFAALGALVVISYAVTARLGELGLTTEISALLTFVLGALCLDGHIAVAAAIAVTTTLLLALKDALHGLAQRIEAREVEATLRFAIITVIVLPLLPDRGYGPAPFDVLNPYRTWLMVVLISGLNLAGYILVKVRGPEHGLALSGLLGGLLSSTAVTLGFSQRSRAEPAQSRALALGILLAWTVMFFRVIAEVAVVNPPLAARVAPAIAVLGVAGLAATLVLHLRRRAPVQATGAVESGGNPLELGAAVRFALAYALITLVAKVARVYAGDTGLYLASALAGITDVDAIALAMANLAVADPDAAPAAARAVGIAVLSNTFTKCAMVFFLASAPLRRAMVPIAATLAVAGVGAVLLATSRV